MKVNLDVVLKDPKGKDLPSNDPDIQGSLTVKEVVINSLLSQTSEKIGGMDKHKCYLTYKKITDAKEIILTAEEIASIKALVDKFYGPIVVGQVYEVLENETKDTKK